MRKVICIYHNKDLDGFCSGAIVKTKYPEAEMIGYDYVDPVPEIEITAGMLLIMTDVSFPILKMSELGILINNAGGEFVFIDHHISKIKELLEFEEKNGFFCKAFLDNSISACEATWKYCYPDKPMPAAVEILGEYDTWRNGDKDNWENMVMPFQYGMRHICNSVETFPYHLLGENYRLSDIMNIKRSGLTILEYQSMIDEKACQNAAFEIYFKGFRAICLNTDRFNSNTFKSVYDEAKHDIMMPFQFNGNRWKFSLYTTKEHVNCSELAKSMGGGGHKQAAGFDVESIREVFPAMPAYSFNDEKV